MNVLRWPTNLIGAALFDIDETMYPKNEEYNKHQRAVEIAAISQEWRTTPAQTQAELETRAQELEQVSQRKPSAAEVIRTFFTQEWLVQTRTRGWKPEQFLQPNPLTIQLMHEVALRYKIAFATTSPRAIATKVLTAIGLVHFITSGSALLLGGEDAPPKPKPDIYQLAAQRLGVSPSVCLSIGDRPAFDCVPAMAIGMGAVVVANLDDLHQVLHRLITNTQPRKEYS